MLLYRCKSSLICAAVEKKFPGDREKLARMSLIEGIIIAMKEKKALIPKQRACPSRFAWLTLRVSEVAKSMALLRYL